ncbi:MAG: hypothetical protein ACI89L_001862 [Phycisphaerales bacterium]|jgi:hypothetical protein
MSKSMSRFAAGAVALAFVAGTASAQLEYYALTSDGNLSYVNGGVQSVIGSTGLNNSVNSLAQNWQSRGGGGNMWASQGFEVFGPPTGKTGHVDTGTGAFSLVNTLSDDAGTLPLGGGIAFDTDGTVWQASQNLLGGTTLFHHDGAGNIISQVNVAISGNAVGALYLRSDGEAIIGDNTGKIYVVNKTNGNISSINATGLAGLTEFSTGARKKDGFFSGSQFSSTWQDVAYAVTNDAGIAKIYRINMFGNNFSLQDTLDVTGQGNMWGLQVIPTPASAALLGLGGLVATRRRRS